MLSLIKKAKMDELKQEFMRMYPKAPFTTNIMVNSMVENKIRAEGTAQATNLDPRNIENDLYGSKEFFEWFRTFDLNSAQQNVWFYRDLYNKLPYPLSRMLDIFFFHRIGINIHDHSPIRPASSR